MAQRKIRRRDLWRYPGHARFLTPVLLAALFGGVAAWQYAERTAFARRAVLTTAAVERIERSGPLESDSGPPSFRIYAQVRYDAGGRTVQSRAYLWSCTVCAVRQRAGDRVPVAYDPHRVTRVVLATGGRVPRDPGRIVSFWAMLALLCLLIAGVILVAGR